MNPGPVVVDERVRQAACGPDMCHREPEFAELMLRVAGKLTRVCGGGEDYASVIFTGSGTAALEAMLCSVVPAGGKLLVIDNGHYGERLAKIAAVHQIPHRVCSFGWAAPVDLARIEKELAADPHITHLAMVHHETSTGMLNPVGELGRLAASLGKSLMVDAISSLGGEPLNVREDHIDWCAGTSNKCLEGLPGISFVCAPRQRLEELASVPPRSFYLNLYGQYAAMHHDGAPPFTPAIPAFLALDAALDLLLAEGVAGRHARYAALAGQLRTGLEALGLRFLLPPEHRSATLTAVFLPDGMDYARLHDRLKACGFVIYAGQESLKQKVFRLANMGRISATDIARFLDELRRTLAEASIPEKGNTG